MNFRSPIFQFFGLIVLIKLIYIAVGYCYLGFPENFSLDTILSLFNKNDSGWYQSITENGYPKISRIEELGGIHKNINYGQSSWAFFPLYPMLVKSLCFLFNLTFNQSAFILSIFLPFLLIILIYRYFSKITSNSEFSCTIVLIIFSFPYSLYIHMYYTESLFMLLVFSSFLKLYEEKNWQFSILACFLVLTRPNAIICLIPLFFYTLELKSTKKTFYESVKMLVYFLPSMFVFALYLVYQKLNTGYFFAFSIAQFGWGRKLKFPWESLFSSSAIELQIGSFIAIIALFLLLIYYRTWNRAWQIYAWLNFVLPLSAGSSISMGRFLLPIFPIFYSLSKNIYTKKYLTIIVVVTQMVLQLLLYYYWLQSHPISY